MHVHTDACQWVTRADGKRRCKTARNEDERAKRAGRAKVDGWEDEYGPVPEPVDWHEWFDEVVVLRLLNKEPVGRRPTPLEWAEFFKRNRFVNCGEAAEVTGLNPEYVGQLSRAHGYTWPATGKVSA